MPAGFADVYEQLCQRFPDPRERGRQFEPLVQEVLRTDPGYQDLYAEVWRWNEWPRRKSADIGVDLVAQNMDGGLTAIQCKCYDPNSTIYEQDLATFLANSNAEFDQRLVISTTSSWSKNLLALISNQKPPVQRMDFFGLEATAIDWDAHIKDEEAPLIAVPGKKLRPHQRDALHDIYAGFAEHDRGKMIMACGTGKTFTALRGAEEIARPGGRVLFAAPSISLVAQALREWTKDSEIPIRAFAVCSDPKVGRGSDSDGAHIYDLPIPATTDPSKLAKAASIDEPDKLTVVFSTYQSMQVIRDAQKAGMPQFDLAVCDEAHRTTGYSLKDEERSNFLMIHDAEAIRARKRLYMTATPRLYNPKAKAKAVKADAYVASMDDEETYGPEFHRLGFDKAVEANLLSDYKVSILVMTEEQIAAEYQQELAEVDGGLPINDVGRVIGCLNGLAKLDPQNQEFKEDPEPMRRAVAFSNTIKASKHFVDLVGALQDSAGIAERKMHAQARHVDGTTGVLKRAAEIAWLGGETMMMDNQCHILSNARCLTEGIDVPALDAVLFLQPRKSQIDVVQAVGRVMRRAEGKKYGYIILPVVVPAGEDPADMLDRNNAYAHVWEVLQALRSHDDRFHAWINKLDLNKTKQGQVSVIGVGSRKSDDEEDDREQKVAEGAAQLVFGRLDEDRLEQWREAIYAKIVERCGERRYWEQWADSVSVIARRHHERITAIIDQPGGAGEQFHEFVDALRGNLNDSITDDDAAGMLSQHLITKPVFDALFGSSQFARLNPVSQAMQGMIDALADKGLEAETEELNDFYASVRRRAEGIDNAEGRQRVAIELYDNFFRKAFPRDAERLGIVYTPVEIVDFIIRSVEDLLQTEFGASLSDEGVHILDPFTGTGTFVARLIQSGLINSEDLQRKYRSEIHANEIMLLAYYIAAVNIENAYHEKMRETSREPDYEPFDGIVLTDTFQSSEPHDRQDLTMFPRNNERMERQLALDIRVILGNPPWSRGQGSHEDDNTNTAYPFLDSRVSDTYISSSTSKGLKNPLYDSYVRAIRWAGDRLLEGRGGIVAYITNSGFVRGKALDGFRKAVAKEFHSCYVLNLRGNVRAALKQEGDNVFLATQTGVAVILLVRLSQPVPSSGASIYYRDIGDFLTRDQKLAVLSSASISDEEWESIEPNEYGDWIDKRSATWVAMRPAAAIQSESDTNANLAPIFAQSSIGVLTARDRWTYNASRAKLESLVEDQVAYYNAQIEALQQGATAISRDPLRFRWDGTADERAKRGIQAERRDEHFRPAMHRPFFRQHLYFDRILNNSVYQLPRIFPSTHSENRAIVVERRLRVPGRPPAVLAVNAIPDNTAGAGASGALCQVLPRFTYGDLALSDVDGPDRSFRQDNINEHTIRDYKKRYDDAVDGDRIFSFVYGMLHSPDYRERYAADLARMLPRIPEVASADDFFAFADAGQRLLDLHIGYEETERYQLHEQVAIGAPDGDARWYVQKMKWGGNRKQPDRSTIIVNDWVTLSGIPEEAHRYVVGPRTALEWLIDRYRIKTDKASGIVNDVNDWGLELDPPNPRYIIDLIKRVTTVSVETMKIVDNLPPLRESK